MPRLLSLYLSATVLKYYAALAFLTLVVASLIEFLENRDGLMDRADLSSVDLVWVSLLAAPGIFSLLAAFIALIAALVSCAVLVRHSELKVMLVSGLGYVRLLVALAPAALVMAGIHFTMENAVLPVTAAELRALGVGDAAAEGLGETDGIWLRRDDLILTASRLRARDRVLEDVRVFGFDASQRVAWQVGGAIAYLRGRSIVLPHATRLVAGTPLPTVEQYVPIDAGIDFETLRLLSQPPREAAVWDLEAILHRSGAVSHPRYAYRLWLNRKLAGPLTTALAVLLLAPFVQRAQRMGVMGFLAAGAAGGFVCFILDGLLTGYAGAGVGSPLLAAWMMPTLFGTAIVVGYFAAD